MKAIPISENIPAALRALPQWVAWKYAARGDKPTKVPVSVEHGWNASSTDNKTWVPFERALAAASASPALAGVGFVFTDADPFCGIDLDGCIVEGKITPEAQAILDIFGSYAEVSPSGKGIKIFIQAKKPAGVGCAVDGLDGMARIEVYDTERFFTVTGQCVADAVPTVEERQAELDALCARLWPTKAPTKAAAKAPGVPIAQYLTPSQDDMTSREARCLAYILACPDAISGQGGHDATLRAACECFRFGLDEAATWRVMQQFNQRKTGGETWTEKELAHKIESAKQKVEAAGTTGARLVEPSSVEAAGPLIPQPRSIIELVVAFPKMRPPLIHGLLRRGETSNLIAAPKIGKSWMALDLAIAIATGGLFLGTFQCEPGEVLLIDNELHPETLANRLPKVIEARGLDFAAVGKHIFVESLRGRLRDLPGMEAYFRALEPGRFALIICDAFYRFLPGGMDENDNGAMAGLYNLIDRYADVTGSAFVLIHHTSKGDQSMKSVTDVGSGAGAQARAPDAHIALRRHEEDKCAVLQAEVRSWHPPAPLCLRWDYPLWKPDPLLDPTALRSPSARKKAGRPPKEDPAHQWTPERFVEKFVTAKPRPQAEIYARAEAAGLTGRRARSLLAVAEGDGLVFRWRVGSPNRADFATLPQPSENEKEPER